MKNFSKTMKKLFVYGAALLVPMIWSATSYAGAVTLTLVRSTLTNVDDAAGRWQHEGGTITKATATGTTTVGQYAVARRVTTGGTTAQNTAMVTITLFFSPLATNYPPQTVTLQGAHNFTSGRFAGSVSGASNRYNWIQGADATTYMSGNNSILYISWDGASQLTLP